MTPVHCLLLIRAAGVAEPRWRRRRPSDVRRCIALVLLACGALASGLLAACAKTPAPPEAGGTPPTHLTTTTAPTTSAPASLSPELQAQRATALAAPKPVKPTEATENTQQGAVYSAVHFLALYRYAFITGDTTDLAAMSEDRCTFCASVINAITDLHSKGGWINPWTQKITNIEYITPGTGKEYCGVRAVVTSTESTSIKEDGKVATESAGENTILFALRYYDNSWHIGEVATE
ncbi:DUF6318 family protein [Actinomyces gaoshouyii]|uniref:DUF6318 family protein n=1 Tax=Actinomyces gaoshouyii TaxID=1960083 RepID=UPI000F772115|nr:DUF6318 family protein [Actinomyces gaoshouyii]